MGAVDLLLQPMVGPRLLRLETDSRLLQRQQARVVDYDVKVAIGWTTLVTTADWRLIQTSTKMAHGKAVQLKEQFEFGITLSQMWHIHGSRELRGTQWTDKAEEPIPPKKDNPRDRDYYGGNRGNRGNDRRGNEGGGRGGGGRVHFDDRTDIVTHLSCNCGGSDINSTYRQCLVSMSASTIYFTALTLFNTGA